MQDLVKRCFVFIVASLVGVAFAHAQVTHPVNVNETITLSSAAGGDRVAFLGEEDRCYCLEVSTRSLDDYPRYGFNFYEENPSGPNITLVPRGLDEPAVLNNRNFPYANRSRVCYINGTSGQISVEFWLGEEDSTASKNDVRVSVKETTLFGGFNTSVTDYNFLEVRNTLRTSSVNVRIRAFDIMSEDTVIDNQTFSVDGGSRVDVDIHTAAGPGTFGNIVLCHDGPPGAIQASVVQYNITNTATGEFAPVAREVLKPRG